MAVVSYILVLTLLFGAFLNSCQGLNNGLALTPPMGWKSLDVACFLLESCEYFPDKCISANLIKRTADRLANDGYLDAGYEYLVIDCWTNNTRAPGGRLEADRERFPLGMKDVADYVHSKGLKFGLRYTIETCVSHSKFIDMEKSTVDTFVEWGIDYVGLAACVLPSITNLHGTTNLGQYYKAFGELLNGTGRDILYSCDRTIRQQILPNYDAAAETCNTWRNWLVANPMSTTIEFATSQIIDWFGNDGAELAKYAGPGHWNDPATLTIGKFGMSVDQAKVQMAVWAILAAPLFIETDLSTIMPEYKRILLNRDIIDVNQDVLGKQGLRILQKSLIDVWKRELHDGSVAIAFVNRRDIGAPHKATFTHAELQLPDQTYDVKYNEMVLTRNSRSASKINFIKTTDFSAQHALNQIIFDTKSFFTKKSTYSVHLITLSLFIIFSITFQDLYHEDELGVFFETRNFDTRIRSKGVKFYKFTKRTPVLENLETITSVD